jgi:lipoprotein-anchoring transpeptidase ErfK/SrfK
MRKNWESNAIKAVVALLLITPAAAESMNSSAVRPQRRVLVSIPDRKLAVIEGDRVVRMFVVAVGAPVSPSPTGEFRIVNRIANPTYYHPGVVIPAGAASPIGTRWIGVNRKGYGIHGTNEPHSIGKAASHGCIRLRNRDMEQLFTLLRVGDVVQIRAERDDETIALFGGTGPVTTVAQVQPAPAMHVAGGQ